LVQNTFIIGEDADVTIVAGCGIHCGTSAPEGHAGVHEFQIGKNARVSYVEKHYATGEGKGRRSLNPTTKIFLAKGAAAEMELTQIGGVDEANRLNEATLVGPTAFAHHGKGVDRRKPNGRIPRTNRYGRRRQPGPT
jgi:Fe-S cluster assembly scaffold protein SufB